MARKATKTIDHPDQLDLLACLDGAPELMAVPEAPQAAPGALNFDQKIRQALKAAIKESGLGREYIAERVSELCGRKVTKPMLDTFTGQGRANRLPVDLLPALTVVLGPTLLNAIAEPAGCRVMERDEVKVARIGQMYLFSLYLQEEQRRAVEDTPLFQGARHV